MSFFVASLAAFIAAHLVLPIPALRTRLIKWFGKRAYLLGYSLLSSALLVWVVFAAIDAPYIELWPLQPWQALVSLLAVPVAAWLLIAGLTQPNALSISFRESGGIQLGPVTSVTRHPVLWGFLLWSVSHAIANGDLVSLIMFGGLTLLAVIGFRLVDLRARRRLGPKRWKQISQNTSIIPFAAVLAGRTRLVWSWQTSLAALVALLTTVWFALQGHRWLIGVDPLALL